MRIEIMTENEPLERERIVLSNDELDSFNEIEMWVETSRRDSTDNVWTEWQMKHENDEGVIVSVNNLTAALLAFMKLYELIMFTKPITFGER